MDGRDGREVKEKVTMNMGNYKRRRSGVKRDERDDNRECRKRTFVTEEEGNGRHTSVRYGCQCSTIRNEVVNKPTNIIRCMGITEEVMHVRHRNLADSVNGKTGCAAQKNK